MTVPASGFLREENWRLAGTGVSVGPEVGGSPQVVAGPTPWWTWEATYRVPRRAHFEWEAFVEGLRGQLIPIEVCPSPDRMMSGVDLAWTGGLLWTGGLTWSGLQPAAPKILAPAAQFASEITVDDTSQFRIGEFFFIGSNCHRTLSKTDYTVRFQPGLRTPVTPQTQISGTGTVRMISADPSLQPLPRTTDDFTDITLRLQERFTHAT